MQQGSRLARGRGRQGTSAAGVQSRKDGPGPDLLLAERILHKPCKLEEPFAPLVHGFARQPQLLGSGCLSLYIGVAGNRALKLCSPGR